MVNIPHPVHGAVRSGSTVVELGVAYPFGCQFHRGFNRGGIYLIRNKSTQQVYVGESSNVIGRWVAHRQLLRRREHYNRRLQEAYNLHGEDRFEVVYHEAWRSGLIQRERFWVEHYERIPPYRTYNLAAV